MLSLSRSLAVNPPGADPALTRRQLWESLVLKAADPVPFVPAIRSCEVLELTPDGLIREIEARGDRIRERVTFVPEERVRFVRLSGRALGTIENVIETEPDGALALRFTFALELEGVEDGSAEERAYGAAMEASYLAAVDATLRAARRRARGEPLVPASLAT